MRYLKLRRTRMILGSFLLASVLLVTFSGIDIRISSLFFDHGFYLAKLGWTRWPHTSVTWFIVVSMVSVVGIYVFNRFTRRSLCGINGKKVVYLSLVLLLGAALIVNVILKDNFGRARPRDIEEFGGSGHFTPAFVISSTCGHNCSFSSGDSAGAFFTLALILASDRKRATAIAGITYGVVVSASRIASGAHFFSDTVVSFFVMLIVADVLYYLMFLSNQEPVGEAVAPSPGVLAYATEKPPAPS